MAILYSANVPVFAQNVHPATKSALVTWIRDQLVVAGWVVTATATDDYKLISVALPAPSPPLQAVVRIMAGTEGNMIWSQWFNPAGTKSNAAASYHRLAYVATNTYNFWSNGYFFLVWSTPPNNPNPNGGEDIGGGCHYMFDFANNPIVECFFGFSMASTASSTQRQSWRTQSFLSCPIFTCVNGVAAEAITTSAAEYKPRFVLPMNVYAQNAFNSAWRFWDSSVLVSEPMIAYSNTTASSEALILGQLYDMAWYHDTIAGDQFITWDNRRWITYTDNNVGSSSNMKGSLIVRVPDA